MIKQIKNAIIIFAKYPQAGNVKTRLARTTGNEFAANFYKICAEHTFAEIKKITDNNIAKYLFYSEESEKDKIRRWVGSDFITYAQTGKNLGEKMKNAFNKIFKNGFEQVLVIGTDLPDLSANLIKDAFNTLTKTEIVIGPSADGGYYLLGMKKLHNFLFEDIIWSTDEVYAETLKKIEQKKLKFAKLTVLNDIDTEIDLKRWLNENASKSNQFLKSDIKTIYPTNKDIKL